MREAPNIPDEVRLANDIEQKDAKRMGLRRGNTYRPAGSLTKYGQLGDIEYTDIYIARNGGRLKAYDLRLFQEA